MVVTIQMQIVIQELGIQKGKKKGLPAKNLMAERRRKKKLNDRLYMLRSVVPKISGVAVSNIVSKTIKEVKHETLNDIPKLLEESESTPGKHFTGSRKLVDRAEMQLGSLDRVNVDSIDNQKPEDAIKIFMMKEFSGTRFCDDLMVPKMRRGKKPE
ncbi:uncharacterized protein Fot_39674 [Forsythia ovata]|uniref:BHLH domain-containing protein n=1 Tax=Forsythia ovata TaxID=205694 RepID=A0ABD1S5D1_9LAMI